MKFQPSKETEEEALQRFLSKVRFTPNCWVWEAGRLRAGYGVFYYHKKTVKAHRYSYETFRGDIPAGFVIDHLCMNKPCVNPVHLDAVTPRTNTMRSPIAPAYLNAQKTHCKRGHLFEEGSYWGVGRRRNCKACLYLRRRAMKQGGYR